MPLKAIGKAIGGVAKTVAGGVGTLASSAVQGFLGNQQQQQPQLPGIQYATNLGIGGGLPTPSGVPMPVTLAPQSPQPAGNTSMTCAGGSTAGFIGWLMRYSPQSYGQYISLIGSVLTPWSWPASLVNLYDQYCASLQAPGGQTQIPQTGGGIGCDVSGLFPFQTVLPADSYTAVLKPPKGYVTVDTPNGGKCFVLKEMARKAGLWKPRPKPAVTAADMRTLTRAASTARKLDRLHSKAAVVTGGCGCSKRKPAARKR